MPEQPIGASGRLGIVILAAGQGTRMKSRLPKVLHPVAGRPMVLYSLDAVSGWGESTPVLVVGHGADQVRALLGDRVVYAIQEPQLGTAHAVLQARQALEGRCDTVLVLYADMPLLRGATLRSLVTAHAGQHDPVTMLTCVRGDSMGFGRVLRDSAGSVAAIVEEAHATPEQLAVKELNPGVYCFDAAWLWKHLSQLAPSPKGEYYLTDLVAVAVSEGHRVRGILMPDSVEAFGINTRVHLSYAEAVARQRIREALMLSGVTIVDPASTYIDAGVAVGQDTVLYPNTHLLGSTHIGEDCHIGPNSLLRDTIVGDRCHLLATVAEEAQLENDVSVGPFAHLRKGAYLASGVHMGNFGEVKNSRLGPGTKMGHFSYLGDAQVGPDVNIGAGTITCNFDGVQKQATIIDEGAFIGSDTMLVAPVKVGKGAKTGAGSVVTHDVEPGSVVYGVPARPRKRSGKE